MNFCFDFETGGSKFKKTSQLGSSQITGTNNESPVRDCVQFALLRENKEKLKVMVRELLSSITKQFLEYTALQ